MNENRGVWRGKRLDNGEWVKGYLNRAFNLVDDGYSKFEVIGNINDNPELIQKGAAE